MTSAHDRDLPRMWPVCLVVILILTGCTSSEVPISVQQYDYSCCIASDVDTIYSPNSTLSLHWKVTKTTVQAPARPGATSLHAVLYGPFETVEELKLTPHAGAGLKAPTLHPDVKAGSAATSEIAIPERAEPGYYDLSFTVDSSDFSTSGDTVVRVQ